jgi:hypothetical protein
MIEGVSMVRMSEDSTATKECSADRVMTVQLFYWKVTHVQVGAIHLWQESTQHLFDGRRVEESPGYITNIAHTPRELAGELLNIFIVEE